MCNQYCFETTQLHNKVILHEIQNICVYIFCNNIYCQVPHEVVVK